MNLDDILQQWSVDCEIKHNLEESSRETPKVHSKYLGYITQAKLLLRRAEDNQQVLLKNKFLWYNGKLSREEVESFGWDPDPFDGLKIMKGDMSYYYESDPEIQQSEAKIVYYKTMIETLKEIIDTLKWRHQQIGNILKWRQFESGS
jgi:hypothetical protein